MCISFQIKYTQGGIDNMEAARAYFSHALKLFPNNMRALFGLFMASCINGILAWTAQISGSP